MVHGFQTVGVGFKAAPTQGVDQLIQAHPSEIVGGKPCFLRGMAQPVAYGLAYAFNRFGHSISPLSFEQFYHISGRKANLYMIIK
jgi:hypothetical protein